MSRVVRTTLDARLQRLAATVLHRHLASLARRHVEDGAVLVLDNASGDILAWVGSRCELSAARRWMASPRRARPARRSNRFCIAGAATALPPPPRCWTTVRWT